MNGVQVFYYGAFKRKLVLLTPSILPKLHLKLNLCVCSVLNYELSCQDKNIQLLWKYLKNNDYYYHNGGK